MSKKFDLIKKKDLPEQANITGFSFLKTPTDKDRENEKFDFTEFSNKIEIGCMLPNKKSLAMTRGYVKADNKENVFIAAKTRIPIFIILFLLLIGIGFGFRYLPAGDGAVDNRPTFNLGIDENAETGDREGKTQEEIQAELNEKVAEGMINISMNTNPVFETGTSKGNLLIVNEEINRHPQVVEIYRKDTEELIYTSGLIPVGSRVDEAKLDVDLPAGEYPCTAYFNSVDEETGTSLGKAGAEIVIKVNK